MFIQLLKYFIFVVLCIYAIISIVLMVICICLYIKERRKIREWLIIPTIPLMVLVGMWQGKKVLMYIIEEVFLRAKGNRIRDRIQKDKFRIKAVDRLRINTDGLGVNTLVVLNNCPLNCKYCLNQKTKGQNTDHALVSVKRLLRHMNQDDLYFRTSGGGVTFGGGEPLLQSEKIKAFKKICPKDWKINIETSLNVSLEHVNELAEYVDYWMIDIKDMNPKIYKAYTGCSNKKVIRNLKWLVKNGYANKLHLLVPHIKSFNTQKDVDSSVNILRGMGLDDIETFEYVTEVKQTEVVQ